MSSRQPVVTDDDHRVIPFRPRTLARPPGHPRAVLQDNRATDHRATNNGGVARLHVVKSIPDADSSTASPDDYRHRMLINLAALMFTLLLTGAGVWLATTIADMRRTQDCVLVGRRDCGKLPPLFEMAPSHPEAI
ncbi:hypothetical protein JQ557_25700 [Bradyrhizobium sp. U87765 SZCCT0131]|nr:MULTISPECIES: hypothetical protein [unclassified Bradyrhizobium]MBR1221420.1 hypothetical protein [Bradyrhizobium sp. U87765 SZCCT0131]MBR1264657.1 hypothetical protein [Bradyrhizobium sp. U87765 SZCCT0134]MBR1304437.1 hypothetical protein [Bradyrhizobium sp. U87765 SZCCT0110]MBR1322706.1 hypothetical protein [Bradyrhizobium sp. U87765 SZCCT0109]MBR1346366.1 hypothetical protein [Bradyrhizobium sp. U87765 SZCCT0048]